MVLISEDVIKSAMEDFEELFRSNLIEINKAFLECDGFKLTFTLKIEEGMNGHFIEPGISIPKGTIKDFNEKRFVSGIQIEMFGGDKDDPNP